MSEQARGVGRRPFHTVTLRDVLTVPALTEALAKVDRSADRMLVDVREMTDYLPEARAYFVTWNRAHRAHISKVAIVTNKAFWRIVIAAMSLASGQKMRAFDDTAGAEAWLDED